MTRLALLASLIVTAVAGAAPAMATPLPTTGAPAPTTVQPGGAPTQGIIMRDGGVCDPIRHMGC
jgi:hypothetical protein